MGRVTYQALAKLSTSAKDKVGIRMSDLPKLVFSNTLEEPLAWRNTRLVKGDIAEQMNLLKQQPGDPLRSIGSINLVKSMIQLTLIDRLRLMIFPLILGSTGREAIYEGYSRTSFTLTDTKVLDSRLILLEYRPVRAEHRRRDSGTNPPATNHQPRRESAQIAKRPAIPPKPATPALPAPCAPASPARTASAKTARPNPKCRGAPWPRPYNRT